MQERKMERERERVWELKNKIERRQKGGERLKERKTRTKVNHKRILS